MQVVSKLMGGVHLSNDLITVTVFMILLSVFVWNNKLPSIDSVEKFVNMLNSRGGNIVVLVALTWMAFMAALRMFYFLFTLIENAKITPENAIAMALVTGAVSFVTGTAFGSFSGALLKTLSGENSKTRSTDAGDNGDVTTVTHTTTEKSTTTVPPNVDAVVVPVPVASAPVAPEAPVVPPAVG